MYTQHLYRVNNCVNKLQAFFTCLFDLLLFFPACPNLSSTLHNSKSKKIKSILEHKC